MKTLHIIIIILIFTSCKTEYKEVIVKYENGQAKDVRIYKDKNNKEDYQIIWYYENGEIKFKGTVKNGKFVGQKINYYENGELKQVDSIIKPCDLDYCCCDGKVTRYDSNGIKTEEFENRNGIENGLVKVYDDKGRLKEKYEMKNGMDHGVAYGYYESGNISFKTTYSNDTISGFIYYFDENGDTLKYFNHYHGEMDFPYKKWLNNGTILYGIFTNEKQNEVLWTWFDNQGKEIKTEKRKKEQSGFVAPE